MPKLHLYKMKLNHLNLNIVPRAFNKITHNCTWLRSFTVSGIIIVKYKQYLMERYIIKYNFLYFLKKIVVFLPNLNKKLSWKYPFGSLLAHLLFGSSVKLHCQSNKVVHIILFCKCVIPAPHIGAKIGPNSIQPMCEPRKSCWGQYWCQCFWREG